MISEETISPDMARPLVTVLVLDVAIFLGAALVLLFPISLIVIRSLLLSAALLNCLT